MIKNLRWYIVGLLTLVTVISYLDRTLLGVAKASFADEGFVTREQYGKVWSCFLIAYGIMHPIIGRFIDWIGTRVGLAVALTWWSLANMTLSLVRGFMSMAGVTFLLGMGESGNLPAGIKVIREWFPARQRALATGIMNAGTAGGAMIALSLGALIVHAYGWRAAFLMSGGLGLLLAVPWLLLGRRPEQHPWISPEELQLIQAGQEESRAAEVEQGKAPLREAFAKREIWVLMLGRFLTDPVWLFLNAWIAVYFREARGFDLMSIALFTWMPYVAADFGSIFGGWLSSRFIRHGMRVVSARKVAMCLSAAVMPAAILTVHVGSWQLAILFMSVVAFGHQSWSSNMLTLPADLFPRRIVASTYGVPAMCGILAGAMTQWEVGKVITTWGYVPAFTVAGCLHPIAAILVVLFVRSSWSTAPGKATTMVGVEPGR